MIQIVPDLQLVAAPPILGFVVDHVSCITAPTLLQGAQMTLIKEHIANSTLLNALHVKLATLVTFERRVQALQEEFVNVVPKVNSRMERERMKALAMLSLHVLPVNT